jgi:hypothetical protein
MSDPRIESLIAKQEIYELSCKYARGLDRLDGALLRSAFFDDAFCEYGFYNGPPGGFVDFCMSALESHADNHHMLGNALIEVDGDEAFGEIYFQAYHKVPLDDGRGYEDLLISGRYLDRYERRDGVWKIAYRTERNDWSRTMPTHSPYFDATPDGLRGGRQDDPVYDHDARRKTS